MKSIYLGPTYDLSAIDGDNITPRQVASLISFGEKDVDLESGKFYSVQNRKVIAIFQGRSEAGPRALGNRSILYDPRDPAGRDKMNTIKHREAFRPFAGTVLKEHANKYFDMAGLDESPYMTFAVDVREEWVDNIPAINHVDNTCRVQTVTREQNQHFYDLIVEFEKLTSIPILLNTSFNLAGEPMVETPEDAIRTLEGSDIDYIYFPEIGKLRGK